VRILAWSDLHVDYPDNRALVAELRGEPGDVLLVAGDVSDRLDRLKAVLGELRERFEAVLFVPGNHDLWVRRTHHEDSLAKLEAVLDCCAELDVHTTPARFGEGALAVWVVPLFGWYRRPEEGADSLFLPKAGEDPTLRMWSDNVFIKWPTRAGASLADHLLARNEPWLARDFDAPVVSFSHFLPRQDLLFSTPREREALNLELEDRYPAFNFSRVAGTSRLEAQLRRLGSVVHVHGHQHRDRYRIIDGVLYVSHCLGYPHEPGRGEGKPPRVVWTDGGWPAA